VTRRAAPAGVDRHDPFADPIRVAISTSHPAARADPHIVRLQDLVAAEPWVSSEPGMGWNEVTVRTCREHGGLLRKPRQGAATRTSTVDVPASPRRARAAARARRRVTVPAA